MASQLLCHSHPFIHKRGVVLDWLVMIEGYLSYRLSGQRDGCEFGDMPQNVSEAPQVWRVFKIVWKRFTLFGDVNCSTPSAQFAMDDQCRKILDYRAAFT